MKTRMISMAWMMTVMFGLVSISEAALVGRLPATAGQFDFQAIYDTDRDITWLQNANLAASNQFGLPQIPFVNPSPGEIGSSGLMSWHTAISWIAGMNAASHLGFNDWRLPTTLVPDLSCAPGTQSPSSFGCQGSELGHLYYIELLNPMNGPLPNAGPFSNLEAHYWSGTEFALDPDDAWNFRFNDGFQNWFDKDVELSVWAVRDGDVAAPAVPTPSAMLLMGSGLVGLVGWRWWSTKTMR